LTNTCQTGNVQHTSRLASKMRLLLAGRIAKHTYSCLTKFLRADVGLGGLTMVEWHTTAIHIFLI